MPRPTGADYMEWAKQVPPRARYKLSASGVSAVTAEEIGLEPGDIQLHGENEYGDAALRAQIAARYGRTEAECMLGEGTSMVNALLMGALLTEPGRILFETPGYEPIRRIAEYFGAEVADVPRPFEACFQVDEGRLEGELRRGARAVWLTNLHNPSGALLDAAALQRIYAAVERAGAWLVVDEVYREFVPGLTSASGLGPRAVVTTSLTKVMGLSGLRIGWAIGDSKLLDRGRRLHGIFSAQTAYPSVCIARRALPQLGRLEERARRLAAEGRAVVREWLARHPEVREVEPAGGLVSFPRLPAGVDDVELSRRMLEKYETSLVPGSHFQAPGHVRLAAGAPRAELEAGLERLGQALAERR